MFGYLHLSLRRCLLFAAAFFLFCPNLSQRCSAGPAQTHQYITIPFAALTHDFEFSPHQLIKVQIRRNKTSPAISALFVFDTGTSHCAISYRLAAKLGLRQHPMMDHSGKPLKFYGIVPPSVTVASLEVGPLHVQGFPLAVFPDKQLSLATHQEVDGFLGASFWSHFATRIDFTHRQITFITPSAEALSYGSLSQNPTLLSSAEITRLGFGAAIVVPMIVLPGRPYAVASIRNGPTSTVDLLLVDSGSDTTFLSKRTQNKLNLKILGSGTFTGFNGTSAAADMWLPGLICGTLDLSDLLVYLALQPDLPQSSSILGLDVLANYDVLLDFPHQKMYLKPRDDFQSFTSRQYEAASSFQRQQWAQKKLMVRYWTADNIFGLAVPYTLTPAGLPLAQVWPDDRTPSSSFLLKSNTHNVFVSSALAAQWGLTVHASLDGTGKPLLLLKTEPFSQAKMAKLRIESISVNGDLAVLPADGLLSWASYEPVPGIIGATVIFGNPVLMDPTTHSWIFLNAFKPEDLEGLGMADAAAIDILDPDSDGIPAVAVQEQQGAAQFTDTMTLATGSPFTLLSAKAAQTLKLTPEPHKLAYGAGKDITIFNQAHLSQIGIGGVVLKDVPVAYPDGAMPGGFYPRLGMNVISRLRLLVDAPGKKMYVKKVGD